MFDQGTLDALRKNYMAMSPVQPRAAAPVAIPKKKGGRGGTATSFISEGGALGGAAAGAALGSVVPVVGTAIGGLLGGVAGAFGGRLAENKVRDDRFGVGDAAKEAALQGVFGGAGKALKYGTVAAKAAKGGAGLEQALMEAAAKSSAKGGGIKGAIGTKMTDGSDNLATRALKLNGSQFNTDFANKTGEEVGQFATRFGLVGKNVKDINEKIYNPGQKVYAAAVNQIGDVPKSDVLNTIKSELGPKLNSSFPEDRAFANSVLDQAGVILNKYGRTIPATELNKLKSDAYSKINNKFVDKSGVDSNSLYDTLSNSFRKTIGEAADKRGIEVDPSVLQQAGLNFKSSKLSEFGNELNALNEITKKIDVASRVGKGKSIFGLNATNGGIGGGVVGGPVGAAAGVVASGIANSPRVAGAASKALDGVGGRLVAEGATQSIPGAVGRAGAAATGASLTDALMGAQSSMTDSANGSMPNMNTTNTNSNMDSLYPTEDDLSSEQVSPYSRDSLLADIQRDPTNADQYIDYYKQLEAIYAPAAGSDLSATTRSSLAQSQNGLDTLSQLEQLFATTGGGSGKIAGSIKNKLGDLGIDSESASYNSLAASTVSQLARALNGGGQVSDADAAVVIQALPKVTDSPEVARIKFAALKQRLAAAQQNTLSYGSGATSTDSGNTDLTSALLAGLQ